MLCSWTHFLIKCVLPWPHAHFYITLFIMKMCVRTMSYFSSFWECRVCWLELRSSQGCVISQPLLQARSKEAHCVSHYHFTKRRKWPWPSVAAKPFPWNGFIYGSWTSLPTCMSSHHSFYFYPCCTLEFKKSYQLDDIHHAVKQSLWRQIKPCVFNITDKRPSSEIVVRKAIMHSPQWNTVRIGWLSKVTCQL